MKKEKPRLLYINHQYRVSSSAGEINARLRKKAMEEAGLEVLLYQCQSSRFKFLPHFWDILKLLPRIRVVCIRIDGTSILEKFSLLKLFKPELKIIWEIHGRVEEVFFNQRSLVDRLVIFKKNLKRKFFAFLVDGVICDSRERQDYVFKNLKINRVFLIPSFVDKKKPSSKPILASVLNRQGFFKVVWGGGGGFRWQALDLIEKVAKKTFWKLE
ncbi:MAG: hypothetical protein JW991_00525 [Candidatus Pacebacteria bacterium]|nr:hypothetical protein [Candidatus Paceibacterota bacterium]